jgi:hypothetical protein
MTSYGVTEQKQRIKIEMSSSSKEVSSGLKWILFTDTILILQLRLYEYFAICIIYTAIIWPPWDRQASDVLKSETPVPPPPNYKVLYSRDASGKTVKISPVHKIL